MMINQETRVVIGADEYNNNPGWMHTQEEELSLLDKTMWEAKFNEASLTAILAEHVWEHLTYEEGLVAAKLCFHFLKPSGYIRCAVPDGYFPDEEYQNIVKVGGPGSKDHPAASHKIVYNYQTLTNLFQSAGFTVSLLEYCDEEGEFHYHDWDEKKGLIFRSKRFDPRNQGEHLVCPSLILDAKKE
ncbi:class I SAM-dependent methyltransferase [Gracilibacillus salinarum]|uniref:SAM-dependent methyltransferase n=1 Tax=Gracilibacillus salinarum TaxID=2932255 RepID=A0ABY4GNH5_9BACI|nr:SAM-dependent methyltransferase [Gracilibacillus salinarum]UOQ85758.1 SAM-dependent methyltransferase [Gracilibacillus salinarum]